ncbi:similar to Saccharomyces cerevisiae YOR078W BUD21 Component of small ribosomal subunit (SSU) processosome that contains U3 snoRNA [Maudiozyma saulgeensis]|uniref:Similar to Saccharomyces cerevisiae YOR078W BUD21 Component of small ribosomal subunit (SSU) processosome that contains U3 snoRNA n=1 Tax=Maudiozyma saulgeensis TaxID=1789683 RepID=A0A1X7QXG2_9SACH|nr:similar to Saccharomyces cerevisiae YOR078W BUD21 Component of small ribosomal subunit (SSU) processosome that contains U3 snoRNA [Kazachstania saulgeensis]
MSSNHVKFDDQEDAVAPSQGQGITINEGGFKTNNKRTLNLDDDESESDDEAPEEEGAAKTKEDIEKKLKVSEDAKKLEQQQLKEKRRKQNALFQEQQSAKKQKVVASEEIIEPLEELPTELLQEVEQREAAKPTHINFDQDSDLINNDSDDSDVERTIRSDALKKKKNQLKTLRKKTINKGPVSVTLLTSVSQSRAMAPKKEVQITSTKDKWLRRKTLNRR